MINCCSKVSWFEEMNGVKIGNVNSSGIWLRTFTSILLNKIFMLKQKSQKIFHLLKKIFYYFLNNIKGAESNLYTFRE